MNHRLRLIITVTLYFLFTSSHEQSLAQSSDDSLLVATSLYIVNQKPDSAVWFFSLVENQTEEASRVVGDVLNNKEVTYSRYAEFVSLVAQWRAASPESLVKFITQEVSKPADKSKLDVKYVKLYWVLIMHLRNESELELAIELNQELEAYVAQFNDESSDKVWAEAYVKTHNIVMNQINGDLDLAGKLCQEVIDEGERIQDTSLIILGQYHLFDNYAAVRDLESAIKIATETYELEKKLRIKTSYHQANLLHLLNVKIYEGEDFDLVLELLQQLRQTQNGDVESYPYYAELATAEFISDSLKAAVFSEFGVANMEEFAELIIRKTEGKLNSHDEIQMLKVLAFGLKNDQFINLSYNCLIKAMRLNEEVYSKDLANVLAEQRTDLALKEQELEFEFERKQRFWFMIIAAIFGLMVVVLIIVLVKQSRQAQSLKIQSEEINNQNLEIREREEEKVLMFKEMHHRVKNNFQIISSLLEFQIMEHTDSHTAQMIKEVTNRIKSMGLIHQKLYENDDLHVKFDEYIIRLCEDLVNVYDADYSTEIKFQIEQTPLDIDTAVPLGLILNELITNAFKHGFGKVNNKSLVVSLKKEEDGEYVLCVKDSGQGLVEGIEVSSAKSMGLRLVNRLAKQLHGSFEYQYFNGAIFKVKFKDTETRKRVE